MLSDLVKKYMDVAKTQAQKRAKKAQKHARQAQEQARQAKQKIKDLTDEERKKIKNMDKEKIKKKSWKPLVAAIATVTIVGWIISKVKEKESKY